jgi:hypothetical protein
VRFCSPRGYWLIGKEKEKELGKRILQHGEAGLKDKDKDVQESRKMKCGDEEKFCFSHAG